MIKQGGGSSPAVIFLCKSYDNKISDDFHACGGNRKADRKERAGMDEIS